MLKRFHVVTKIGLEQQMVLSFHKLVKALEAFMTVKHEMPDSYDTVQIIRLLDNKVIREFSKTEGFKMIFIREAIR